MRKLLTIIAIIAAIILVRFGIQTCRVWSFRSEPGPTAPNEFSALTYKVFLDGSDEPQTGKIVMRPGETYLFQIQYRNVTSEQVPQVSVDITIPDILKIVPGSVEVLNVVHPQGHALNESTTRTNGFRTLTAEIGNYAPQANAFIRFRATVYNNLSFELSNRDAMWVSAYSENELVESCQAFDFLRVNHVYGSVDAISVMLVFFGIWVAMWHALKFFN